MKMDWSMNGKDQSPKDEKTPIILALVSFTVSTSTCGFCGVQREDLITSYIKEEWSSLPGR